MLMEKFSSMSRIFLNLKRYRVLVENIRIRRRKMADTVENMKTYNVSRVNKRKV